MLTCTKNGCCQNILINTCKNRLWKPHKEFQCLSPAKTMMSRYGVTIEVLRFATGGWGEKSSWLRYLRIVLRSKPVRDEIFEIEYPFWLKSLISLIWDIVSISFPPLPLVVLRQRISDRLFCFNMSLSDFEEFPFWYWGILSPISGTFIIRYTDSNHFSCMLTFCTYLMRCTYPWHWIKYSTNYNRCHPIFSLSW